MKTSLLILISFSALLLYLANIYPCHNWGDDFAAYLHQAKSIVEGSTPEFSDIASYRVAHSAGHTGPAIAPWGFPILLAPVYALFGLSLIPYKLYMLFFTFGTILLSAALFRRYLTNSAFLGIFALLAFNPALYAYSTDILSDIPHLFFTMLCFFLMDRWFANGSSPRHLHRKMAVICLVIFFASLIRHNGLLLIPCFLLSHYLFLKQQPKTSLVNPRALWPYAFMLACFFGFRYVVPADDPSRIPSALKDLFSTDMRENLVAFSQALPGMLLYLPVKTHVSVQGMLHTVQTIVFLISLPFFILGTYKRWKAGRVWLVYVALTIGLNTAVPYFESRYIFPIIPFYFYFMFVGIETIAPRIRFNGIRTVFVPACSILLFCFVLSQCIGRCLYGRGVFSGEPTGCRAGPFAAPTQAVVSFIQQQTAEDAVLAFFKPRAMSLFTDRKTIKVSRHEDFPRHRVDYYIQHKGNGTDRKFVSYHGAYLTLVFENKYFGVFQSVP